MNAYYCGQYVVLVGKEYDDKPHRHYMKHILIGLDKEVNCNIRGKEICAHSILIQSDVEHQIYPSKEISLLYLIPDCCDLGREIEYQYFKEKNDYVLLEQQYTELIKHFRFDFLKHSDGLEFFSVFQNILNMLSIRTYKKYICDLRVLKCMRFINENIENEFSLKKLAAEAFLSSSRLSHLFKKETGVTIQNYILLQRIMCALRKVENGENITQACLEAGFSSPSHYADTISQWFGLSTKRSMDFMKNKIFSI